MHGALDHYDSKKFPTSWGFQLSAWAQVKLPTKQPDVMKFLRQYKMNVSQYFVHQ